MTQTLFNWYKEKDECFPKWKKKLHCFRLKFMKLESLIEWISRSHSAYKEFEYRIQTLTQKDFENKLEIMNRCLSMKKIRNTNMQNRKANILETCLEIQYFSTVNEHWGIIFSIWRIGDYSINSIKNLIILNYTYQSINFRFRIT